MFRRLGAEFRGMRKEEKKDAEKEYIRTSPDVPRDEVTGQIVRGEDALDHADLLPDGADIEQLEGGMVDAGYDEEWDDEEHDMSMDYIVEDDREEDFVGEDGQYDELEGGKKGMMATARDANANFDRDRTHRKASGGHRGTHKPKHKDHRP